MRCPPKRPTVRSNKYAAQRLAAYDGVSLNQFIAVAEKIGTLESTDLFLKQRAPKAKPPAMSSLMHRAPSSEGNAPDR